MKIPINSTNSMFESMVYARKKQRSSNSDVQTCSDLLRQRGYQEPSVGLTRVSTDRTHQGGSRYYTTCGAETGSTEKLLFSEVSGRYICVLCHAMRYSTDKTCSRSREVCGQARYHFQSEDGFSTAKTST
ncbi:hypothetical protein RRG08_036478 [Elysia crispata]|uniref:Uncharacterized protein n=1 Tax=Elysia crispata TaxID=231223 RepID=A0AAE1DIQ1_9GAST|nr:hypothetical protein RRG08_036478 [Elysia crispata]